MFTNNTKDTVCPDKIPVEFLLEHTIRCTDTWGASSVQPVQLQMWRDEICRHLCIRGRPCSTATVRKTFTIYINILYVFAFKT